VSMQSDLKIAAGKEILGHSSLQVSVETRS